MLTSDVLVYVDFDFWGKSINNNLIIKDDFDSAQGFEKSCDVWFSGFKNEVLSCSNQGKAIVVSELDGWNIWFLTIWITMHLHC